MSEHDRSADALEQGEAEGTSLLNEATLRALIEQIPLTVYIDRLDEVSSNVYTSPQLESVLGYSAEEWVSDEGLFLKVLHPDDRERVLAEHRRTRETGEPFRMEYRMVARDGTVCWFRDEAAVIPDETGIPRFHYGFLHDITERRELEEALRRSEEELRRQKRHLESLLEISPTAIVTLDLDGTVTSWSLAAHELFGYTRDEAVGRDLEDLIANRDDLRAEAVEYHAELVRAGRFHARTRRVRKDGSLLDVELFAVPIAVDAEPSGYLVVYHDVTAITAQHEAEKRYRELVEQLPLVTYIDEPAVAPSIYISPQIERLLGYSAEEWLADPELFLKLLHPDDRERVLAEHDRVFAAGEASWSFEYRLVARDGRTVAIRDDAVVIKDNEGNPLYVQGFLMDVTKRKEAEDALRRREADLRRQTQYYESLLEISPVGVVTLDLEERVTSWNPAAEKLFGYSEAEALGQMIQDLTLRTETLYQEGVSIMQEAIAEGSSHRITRRMRKDGALVDVEVLVVPLRMDGEPIGSYAIYHDVSELHRQKQYFQSLLEISPTAIITVDLEDKVTSWNPAAEKLFGYAPVEAVGRNVDDLVAASDEVRADAADVNRRGSEGEVELITRRTRKDGSLVDVHVLVAPIFLEGELVGRYGIYHDISELQRQKQYFQSLLDNSPTAIAAIDLDDMITAWNPAAEMLFGYTREEAIGRNIDDLVANAADVRPEAAEVNRQALENGQVHLITRRTRKDGSLVDVELLVAPVVMGGRVEGFYAIYHDIGELMQARREAENATQAKSAFLATMSHEIRTPMNAVIGMTELLLDTRLSAEQRGFAEIIRTSGDSLLTIIDDILDFSKIEAGRLELEYRPFVLGDCVESALDIVAASASAKGIDLACLVDPEAPAAFIGDPTRLRQILGNLLANAVKFTDEGEVVLSVECAEIADGGERSSGHLYRLDFAVRDTGIGIPADRMDRLFQSFSQADASTTRRYGGTGLGLAISKRLSELMGGTMWAESRTGAGSTFHFTVTAEAARSPVELSPRSVQLKGKHLLVVDDNAANREVVRRRCTVWGIVARDTGSPAEALEWIRSVDRFDVALLDMQMPEMDGLTLAREIRRHRAADSLPLIMLTSLGHRREDADVEFAAYLSKPIKASQLYDVLSRVLASRPERVGAPGGALEPAARAVRPTALRILLVEDNEVNRRLALAMLAKLGYRADVAENGVEAVAALEQGAYDVVLMDVEMPEMDGLEATRRIRAQRPRGEGPRIVAMTANAMEGDRKLCLAAGMDDYLAKPVRPQELADALGRNAPKAPVAKEASAGDGEVFAPAALDRLRETLGDDASAFLGELIGIFLADAPTHLAAVRKGLERDDVEAVRRAAHTLKSNARTFGAAALAEACQELEEAARVSSFAGAAALVERIEVEYARLVPALEAERQG